MFVFSFFYHFFLAFFLFSKIANRVFAVFDNMFCSFVLTLQPKTSTL